jgi:hypothetical protein
MAPMRARLLVRLLLLYVALDFANPMMPGAVSFDPGDCVEGAHLERARAPDSVAATPVRVAAHLVDPLLVDPPLPSAVRNPRPCPPRIFVTPPAQRAAGDPPPPGDDH